MWEQSPERKTLRRFILIVLLALGVIGAGTSSWAQSSAPQPGDPPVLARISVSLPDADGKVTITGDTGAVFPNAYVVIRNLYTGSTVTTRAGGHGSFSALIYGSGNTPFWISPSSQLIPPDSVDTLGSLPGGPGAILYGLTPDVQRFTLSGQMDTGSDTGDLVSGRARRQPERRAGRGLAGAV